MPDPQVAAPAKVPSASDPAALAQYLQSLFAPASSGASGLLNKLVGPGGIYDPTTDFASLAAKSQLAGTLPTQADIDAQNAGNQAKGADYLYQQLSGVPVPQEAPLEQPNLPQLQLPDQPQIARAQVSPLAQILAIGAGFAHPQGAGQFNAAALEGAIRGAEEENQRRQQRDKTDVARRAMLYDASMSAAKERERITEANRDTAFRNTVATTDRQMLLAKAKTEQFTAHGAADSLKAFADKYDPALKARDEVKSLLDQIDLRGKASAERIKSVAELLTAVHKEDAAGPGMAKDVFNQIMEGTRADAKSRADEARQTKIADMQEQAAMARTQVQQAGETKRVTMQTTAALNRELIAERGRNSRFAQNIAATKPPQNLKQSQENQARLQDVQKRAEKDLMDAKTDLATLEGGGTIAGWNAHNGGLLIYRMRRDARQSNVEAAEKAIQVEQKRAQRLAPKGGVLGPVKQIFDPVTGEGISP